MATPQTGISIGKTEKYLQDKLLSEGVCYFILIDPEKPGDVSTLSRVASEEGATAIMIGGTTAQMASDYEAVISEVKRNGKLPVLIFPSNTASVARGADAIWFMSLLNSDDPYYIIGAQMLGIPGIKKFHLEPIPLAYIIVGYGGTVGYVGRARPIPYERQEIGAAYAMAAEALGMRFVYFEGGSGAPTHIPPEFIAYSRRFVKSTIMVGGGITNGKIAESLVEAGADAIVTGNVLEGEAEMRAKIKEILAGCKEGVERRRAKA